MKGMKEKFSKNKVLLIILLIIVFLYAIFLQYYKFHKLELSLTQLRSELISQEQRIIDLQRAQSKSQEEARSNIDIENTVLRIEKISQEIESLPVITSQVKHTEILNKSEKSPNNPKNLEPFWRRFLGAVLEVLRSSIIVRQHTFPLEPLLAPTEQVYLVANIRSQLGQASWAVMHKQPLIYQHAMQQSIQWIRQYYREDLEPVQDVLQRLVVLSRVAI